MTVCWPSRAIPTRCWSLWTASRVVGRYPSSSFSKSPMSICPMCWPPRSMWIIAPEIVQQFGDLKKPGRPMARAPSSWSVTRPNVKTVFKRNPDISARISPMWMASSGWCSMTTRPAWRCIAPARSTAAHRAGGLCARRPGDAQESHPRPGVPGFPVQRGGSAPHAHRSAPFNDVRVRRAISHAIDRRDSLGRVHRGQADPCHCSRPGRVVAAHLTNSAQERSTISDQRGPALLLAEAGYPKGFKTPLTASTGYGRGLLDVVQLLQQYLKGVGMVRLSSRIRRVYGQPCSASTRAWCMVPCPLLGTGWPTVSRVCA